MFMYIMSLISEVYAHYVLFNLYSHLYPNVLYCIYYLCDYRHEMYFSVNKQFQFQWLRWTTDILYREENLVIAQYLPQFKESQDNG